MNPQRGASVNTNKLRGSKRRYFILFIDVLVYLPPRDRRRQGAHPQASRGPAHTKFDNARFEKQLENFDEAEYRQLESFRELFEFMDDIVPLDEDEEAWVGERHDGRYECGRHHRTRAARRGLNSFQGSHPHDSMYGAVRYKATTFVQPGLLLEKNLLKYLKLREMFFFDKSIPPPTTK
ncbi:hypothetical protein EDB86DRAFT_104481 [Lactarius hatsudake]|nr:hypothetical protein EDB86DRAFT_104481 [Lactarius hatsudake]